MTYDDGKEEFRVELPSKGETKKVRFNPMHAKAVAAQMLVQFNTLILTIKRKHGEEWHTEMVALYEDDGFKFYTEDKG